MSIRTDNTRLSDAEMSALAALAFVDAVDVLAANADRANRGEAPAYSGCSSDAADRLRGELKARGVL